MKTNKLKDLAKIEGHESIGALLNDSALDAVVPGICMVQGSNYTTKVEPDQERGYCESCEKGTVQSCLVIAGII